MKVVIRALGILALALAVSRSSAAKEANIGRYNVVEVGEKAILIDTATGDTWLLDKSPTSDNESRHVWLKIPSPFAAPVPVPTSEPPSPLVAPPVILPPREPDETPAESSAEPSDRLSLDIRAPARLAVGDSGTFALYLAPNKQTCEISEVRIELPPNLVPLQASEGYQRDQGTITWHNVETPPNSMVAHAVQAKAKQADKEIVIRYSATVGGETFETEQALAVEPHREADAKKEPADERDGALKK